MTHARDEYLFQYSIYVLESSSTSSRLTYFFPPLVSSARWLPVPTTGSSVEQALTSNFWGQNLIALLFRPLRLIIDTQTLRQFRILILKFTHAPFVAVIYVYESSRFFSSRRSHFPPASSSSMHLTNGGQARPLSANVSRFTALRPAALAPSTPRQSQTLPGSSTSALSSADLTEMLTLMQKLSAQVDELTTRVAGQSEN